MLVIMYVHIKGVYESVEITATLLSHFLYTILVRRLKETIILTQVTLFELVPVEFF